MFAYGGHGWGTHGIHNYPGTISTPADERISHAFCSEKEKAMYNSWKEEEMQREEFQKMTEQLKKENEYLIHFRNTHLHESLDNSKLKEQNESLVLNLKQHESDIKKLTREIFNLKKNKKTIEDRFILQRDHDHRQFEDKLTRQEIEIQRLHRSIHDHKPHLEKEKTKALLEIFENLCSKFPHLHALTNSTNLTTSAAIHDTLIRCFNELSINCLPIMDKSHTPHTTTLSQADATKLLIQILTILEDKLKTKITDITKMLSRKRGLFKTLSTNQRSVSIKAIKNLEQIFTHNETNISELIKEARERISSSRQHT